MNEESAKGLVTFKTCVLLIKSSRRVTITRFAHQVQIRFFSRHISIIVAKIFGQKIIRKPCRMISYDRVVMLW